MKTIAKRVMRELMLRNDATKNIADRLDHFKVHYEYVCCRLWSFNSDYDVHLRRKMVFISCYPL